MKNFFKLMKYEKKSLVALWAILNSAYAGCLIMSPYICDIFIDSVTGHSDIKNVAILIGIQIALYLITQVLMYVMDIVEGKCEITAYSTIVAKASKNMEYYDIASSAPFDVNQELGTNYEKLLPFFFDYPVKIFIYTIQAVSIVYILFRYSVLNGLLVVACIPVFILLTKLFGEKISEAGEDTIDAAMKCRVYVDEQRKVSESERFYRHKRMAGIDKLIKDYAKFKKLMTKQESIFSNFGAYALLNVVITISLILCGAEVWKGVMTAGMLYGVQLYVSKIWDPIESLIDIYKDYIGMKLIINDFDSFMHINTIDYNEEKIDDIKLINYQSRDRNGDCLHEPINIDFIHGKIYTIIGENGSGKSSMVKAILGLSRRFLGEIKLNGFGENNNFSYCESEPLESTFFVDDISKLSMGQKKIAQVNNTVAEDKDVYIFDEPTNYLDEAKKQQIKEILLELKRKNKIVILVTHDKELLPICDQIIELKKLQSA